MSRLDTTYFNWALFRHDIKKDVRTCIWYLLFALGVNLLVASVVQGVGMMRNPKVISDVMQNALGGELQDIGDTSQALMESLDSNLLSAAVMAGAVVGPLVFLICRKRRFFTDVAMPARERLTPGVFFTLLLATQAVQYLYGHLVTFIDMLLKPAGGSISEGYSDIMDQFISPVGIVYIVLVGPVFEELVFRGALLGMLRKYGENFAIVMSSLCFGFFHMVILQIPFAFFIGLLLGYAASRFSLRVSILLHIIVNGLSMVSTISRSAEELYGYAILACTIVAIAIFIIQRRGVAARIRAGGSYYDHTFAYGLTCIPFLCYCVGATIVGVIESVSIL